MPALRTTSGIFGICFDPSSPIETVGRIPPLPIPCGSHHQYLPIPPDLVSDRDNGVVVSRRLRAMVSATSLLHRDHLGRMALPNGRCVTYAVTPTGNNSFSL
jgi:hypothetical protein